MFLSPGKPEKNDSIKPASSLWSNGDGFRLAESLFPGEGTGERSVEHPFPFESEAGLVNFNESEKYPILAT